MVRFAVVALGVLLLLGQTDMVKAMSRDRPVVRIHCADTNTALPGSAMTALCQNMVQSLAAVLPGANFRQVGPDQMRLTRSKDALVAVTLSGTQASLSWQVGQGGSTRRADPAPGPKQALSGKDLRRWTDGIVQSTPHLIRDLQTIIALK